MEVHAFTAQLIDTGAESAALQDALADAGCLDIEVASHGTLLSVANDPTLDLVVVAVHRGDCAALRRIVAARQGVRVVAVCDESDIDAAFAAGAAQCVTRPVRRRELAGRIRDTMRGNAATRTTVRERAMSETIAALQREKQDLERLACVDPLTGVANRRHALELLAAEWARCTRDHRPLAVVMIDLDCFHAYNENYGHPGGDRCLALVTDAMVRCLRRPSDFLGRYGGEEFMAILPNTDAVGARIVAERLRAAVENLGLPHIGSVCSPVVTITAGFASIRVLPEDSADRLIAAADASLLEAKSLGRNRVGGHAPLVKPSRVSAQRWERYAPVYVDPWYADQITAFLDSVENEARSHVDNLHRGERGSGIALRRLEEKSRRFELTAVGMLLRDLATAVREAEPALLRAAADELVQYVMHVQVVYRRTCEDHLQISVARTG